MPSDPFSFLSHSKYKESFCNGKRKKVCRNTRCAFFFFVDYKNRLIFFKLRYFEDFFDLCVRNI